MRRSRSRVFSDSEQGQIELLLGEAMSRGTDTVLVGNIGHIPMAKRLGFAVHGDFGLNAYNSRTLCALAEMGVSRQTLSFEARLAQIRDMEGPLETDLIVYGRLPLMIFENCAIRRADRPPQGELSAAAGVRLPQHAHRQPSTVPARGFRAARRADCPSAVHNGKPGGVRTHRTCVPQRCATRGRVHARLI